MRLPSFFSSRSETVTLAVDSAAVRFLTVQDGSVVKWGSAALDPELFQEGIIQQPQEVGRIIAELLAEHQIPKNRVVTSVPGAQAIHRIITLPAMRREDLNKAVMYQIKREMPIPTEELALAWQLLGGSSDRQNQVFVIAIPRDIMGPFVETLQVAGVQPKAIDIKPLALARVPKRPNAIIGNVESDSIDIVCLLDYAPLVVRSLYFPFPTASPQELGERLADELQRSIRAYNDNNRQQPIGTNLSAFLTGGGTDYFSLVEALYGTLEFTVERLVSPIAHPEDFPVEEYATNLGLALKGSP